MMGLALTFESVAIHIQFNRRNATRDGIALSINFTGSKHSEDEMNYIV